MYNKILKLNILITQQSICLHGKLFIREQAERLREAFTGVQGADPWLGLQGGSALLPKKILYLVS